MREELGRFGEDATQVLGAGHGKEKGARVEQKSQFAGAKKGLQIETGRVKTERVPIFIRVGEAEDAGLRDGQDVGANRRVVVVLKRNSRNDEVVRVVAAGKKDADQSLIVVDAGLGDGGVHEPQV